MIKSNQSAPLRQREQQLQESLDYYKQLSHNQSQSLHSQSKYIEKLQQRCSSYQLQINQLLLEKQQLQLLLTTKQSSTQSFPLKQTPQKIQYDHAITSIKSQSQFKQTPINNNQKQEQFLRKTVKHQQPYIKINTKWKDFNLHPDIIQALKVQKKNKPTAVQAETFQITLNNNNKKYNYLIRLTYGTGKTLCLILPILKSLKQGLKIAQDKVFRGKVIQNEIFKPQGVILVQNSINQQYIQNILKQFIQYGQKTKSQKLNFKLGRLDKQGHTHGDIIICQAKSFLNRHQRGNMNLEQCKIVTIPDIEDIYYHDKDSLAKVLQIVKDSPNTSLISSTVKFDKWLNTFYSQNSGKFQTNQITPSTSYNIFKQSINNYYKSVEGGQEALHNYVIKQVFKALYSDNTKLKPQIILFFNSIEQINRFKKIFQTLASDFTSQQSYYLKGISTGIIAPKIFKDGKKQQTTIAQKNQIIQKFRNNQTNVLLATNIIARGFDCRNAVLVINVNVPKRNEKDDAIDVDRYMSQAAIVGKHFDKGIALTITQPNTKTSLIDKLRKMYELQIKQLTNLSQLTKQVYQ